MTAPGELEGKAWWLVVVLRRERAFEKVRDQVGTDKKRVDTGQVASDEAIPLLTSQPLKRTQARAESA